MLLTTQSVVVVVGSLIREVRLVRLLNVCTQRDSNQRVLDLRSYAPSHSSQGCYSGLLGLGIELGLGFSGAHCHHPAIGVTLRTAELGYL